MYQNPDELVDGFIIDYTSQIGDGANSKCFKCQNQKYEVPLCVKIIESHQNAMFDREIEVVQILTLIDCCNLVKIFHVSKQSQFCFIFMEYCQQGDFAKTMSQFQIRKRSLTTQEILSFLSQVINGYKHIYKLGIIHRDIKPANIFIGNNGCYQIGDYGTADILENPSKQNQISRIGTPLYASPQVLFEETYSNKCDIYSLGVMIYELVYSDLPIRKQSFQNFCKAVEYTKYNQIEIKQIPEQLGGSQYEKGQLIQFLQKSLVYYESSRISWEELFVYFGSQNLESKYQQNISENQQSLQIQIVRPSICRQKSAAKEIKNVVEKIIEFYLAKCSFVEKLLAKIQIYTDFMDGDNQQQYFTKDAATFHFLQLLLYGYKYSCLLNLNYLLFKNRKKINELQIQQELIQINQNFLKENINAYLNNNSESIIIQREYIQQDYNLSKQSFKNQIGNFQMWESTNNYCQLQQLIPSINSKVNLYFPKFYYQQYKNIFDQMNLNLNLDFNAQPQQLQTHQLEFQAFSIQFFQNEEKYKHLTDIIKINQQFLIDFSEDKQFMLRVLDHYLFQLNANKH